MKGRVSSVKSSDLSAYRRRKLIEALEPRQLLSTTYYVSPSGLDSNAGTSTGAPWATVTKVDNTVFQPGDQILFQRGGEWHGQLTASASGTAANPIVYGDYGNTALTKPTFDGSDVVPTSAFSLVSGSTYSFSVSNVPGAGGNAYWVYANHAGMLAAAASDASSGGVQSNANSFYINGNTVYINTGGTNPATNGVVYTLGDRGAGVNPNSSLINSNAFNYITFQNIVGRETAEVGGGNSLTGGINDGYVWRIQGGSNVTLLNVEGYNGSKHIFGAIDTTNFVANGVIAQGCPEAVAGNGLPYGNATATVSYSDNNQTGDTYQWINVTVSNYDGSQPAFLTHNDGATSIASILLQNFNSVGAPIALQPGTNVAITMKGGSISNNTLTAYTSTGTTELIDGVALTGAYPFIQVNGNATVQNCVVTDSNQPAIQVTGPNNVIRFNTLSPFGYATAIDLRSGSTNDTVLGNIISGTANAMSIASGVTYTADYDYFDTTNGSPIFSLAGNNNSLSQFQSAGHETHAVTGNPQFTSPSTHDYSLQSTSTAINVVPTAGISGITTDIRGFTRPSANVYDDGAYEFQSTLHQPTISIAAAANPNPVTGTTTNLSVLGASVDGEATLNYTWSTTGSPPAAVAFSANGTNAAKNTTATFSKAGSYTFQANVSNGSFSVTSSVVVTVNQTATGVTISPLTKFVGINTTQQYTAIVADQFGFAVAGSSVTYSIQSGGGSINPTTGLFTAPGTTGTTIVKATSGASSATATATITPPNQAPTVATAASASPNPVTSTSTTLSVLGADDNGEANLTYTWSLIGTPPAAVTFSANGTNAAKSVTATFTANGTYNFLVTITDSNGLSTTSSTTANVSIFVPIVVDGKLDGRYGTPIAVQTQATNLGTNSLGTNPTAPYSQMSALYGIIDQTSGQLDLFIAGSLNLLNAHIDLFIDSVSGAGATGTGVLLNAGGPWNASGNGGFSSMTFDTGFRPDHLFTATFGGGYSLDYYNFDTNTHISETITDPAIALSNSTGSVPYFTERVNNTQQNTIIAANTGAGVTTGAEFAFNLSGLGYTTANFNAGQPIGIMAFLSFGSHTQATSQTMPPNSLIGTGSYGYFGGNFDFTNSAFPGNQYLTVSPPAAPAGPTIATAAAATPSPVTSGNNTSLSVLGADSAGESGLTYTWSLTGTPPASVNFSANGTNAAKNTIATFTANGTYNFLVTVTDLSNLTTTSTVTVNVSSFGSSGNQAPTVATAAAANPSPVTGTTTALSVLGADDAGESNLTYTWATTGTLPASVNFGGTNGTNAAKNLTATFTKAGSYNLQVTIMDVGGLSVTSSVSVTVNQTPTTVSVTPPTPSVAINTTQQFAATVYDQFNNLIASPTVTWSLQSGGLSISSTGLYTAPASAGSATVKAVVGSASGTAAVTITATSQGPTVATPANAGSNPVSGKSVSLSVLGSDAAGETSLTYTWTGTSVPTNAPPVTFSANGTHAASNTTVNFYQAGVYTLTATIMDPSGFTTTSTVVVTVNQTVTQLFVLPPKLTLSSTHTQQYTVLARDQFSNTVFTPSVAWSATGGGTINSTGLFTANSSTGTYTVQAVSGLTATTTVTVQASGPTVLPAASTLLFGPSELIDVGTGGLVVPAGGNSGLATTESLVSEAANFGVSNWNGLAGITSSAAKSDPTRLTAVGVILNNNGSVTNPAALYSTFEGSPTSLNDVLVKYTYFGDATLDGKVDGSDYTRIDSGYLNHATGWFNGDFNYDGVVDGSDYTLIDNAFNSQGAAKASLLASPADKLGTRAVIAQPAATSNVFSNIPIASVASEIFDSGKEKKSLL